MARSHAIVTKVEYREVLNKGVVGIGQLFRVFNVLPDMTLHRVGRFPGGFWRYYSLKADGINCDIFELFPNGLFQLATSPPRPIIDWDTGLGSKEEDFLQYLQS